MRTIFGREPAVLWAAIAAVLQGASLLFGFDPQVQGLVNAALVALAGFATAAMVSVDAALPALVGLIKAVLALVIGFGIQIPDTTQVAIMAVVTGVAAFWVRGQVVATVPAVASRPVGAHAPFRPGGGW